MYSDMFLSIAVLLGCSGFRGERKLGSTFSFPFPSLCWGGVQVDSSFLTDVHGDPFILIALICFL